MNPAQHTEEAPKKATRREWIGLAVLTLPCQLAVMDLTVLNLAVPHLTTDLKPTSSQLLWIIDIYGFLIAGSLITMGTLGDRIGRRKVLMIGAAAFGAASMLAAFSRTAEMLIVSRALLGIAGATLAPSTLSLLRNMFHDPRERAIAVSFWATSFSVGGAIGPVVGGVLLESFWWGSVFLLAVPVMVLLLGVGPFLLPEFRDPNAGKLDLWSAAQSMASVLAVIYGLKRIAEVGFQPIALLSVAVGLAIGVAFVRRQNRLTDPLIDLGLFRNVAFRTSVAINTFCCFAGFGIYIALAQYLQLVLGLSPLEAGLWMFPASVVVIFGSLAAPHAARRVRPAYLMAGSLLVVMAGFLILTGVRGDVGLFATVLGTIVYSAGFGPIFPLSIDIIMSSAPAERAGAAAGVSETSTEFGGALGIAVLGSLSLWLYRSQVLDAIPAGIPKEAAASARSTLGGAVAVAKDLPEALGNTLLLSAREAFAQSFRLTAVISAALVLILAIVVLVTLRHVKPNAT